MITSQSLVTDPLFLEQITGVRRKKQEALKETDFVVKIPRDAILEKIIKIDMDPDTKRINTVQWVKKDKMNNLRRLFTDADDLPSVFVPVANTLKDKLSGTRGEALLNARCTNWLSGCSTTVVITFGLLEVMAKKRVRVRFNFSHYNCHNHPVGIINGQVRDKAIRAKFHGKEPRVATIECYTEMKYDPFNSVRRVPTHDAARRIRSDALKAGCLDDDLIESLRLKQEKEQNESQFLHLPAHLRGHLHLLTPNPKPGVAFYCEKCV